MYVDSIVIINEHVESDFATFVIGSKTACHAISSFLSSPPSIHYKTVSGHTRIQHCQIHAIIVQI